jgi:HSP20 family protein
MPRVITCDPFRNFRSFQGEINRLFDRDFDDSTAQLAHWPMHVDIREDENQIIIKADVPGMEEKDINVNIDNSMLTISGERKFADVDKRNQYHRVERAFGRFSRSFQLENSTDAKKISASYRGGRTGSDTAQAGGGQTTLHPGTCKLIFKKPAISVELPSTEMAI